MKSLISHLGREGRLVASMNEYSARFDESACQVSPLGAIDRFGDGHTQCFSRFFSNGDARKEVLHVVEFEIKE